MGNSTCCHASLNDFCTALTCSRFAVQARAVTSAKTASPSWCLTRALGVCIVLRFLLTSAVHVLVYTWFARWHGFGVVSRTQMTPAKQPSTTRFCLSACLSSHVVARDNCMAAGVGVEVNTQIFMSWAKISNVPWYPHPFQCRPNPRECPLT